jgi:carbon-monoxide dehydrogenase small subunit
MVMAATALLRERPNADAQAIREQLEGNMCRCTGYQNIVLAALDAAAALRSPGVPA